MRGRSNTPRLKANSIIVASGESDPAAAIELSGVCKQFEDVKAVDGVSLTITPGEFVALVGTSGSGKSTLLKMINRLIEPDAGRIHVTGHDVSGLPLPQLRRSIGYVFQGIGLFPHMSVGENIGIGLRVGGEEVPQARVDELLDLVGLADISGERMPDELSGGQRQRVGVARALAARPRIMLMDEPFGALDPVTRADLGAAVRDLHNRLGLTTVMVTHDMSEALLLGSRVLVMGHGSVTSDCTPKELVDGGGDALAQALVAVPRAQAERLARIAS